MVSRRCNRCYCGSQGVEAKERRNTNFFDDRIIVNGVVDSLALRECSRTKCS